MNDTILLIAVISILNVVCFFIGAKIGQLTVKGKDISIPNPVRVVEEYKEDRERRKEVEEINTMLDNIDSYDGTGLGQKDI